MPTVYGEKTLDRNGKETVASYDVDDHLTGVTFPDGRSLAFLYAKEMHNNPVNNPGKLKTVTETGVGGGSSRTWHYYWDSSPILTRIDRPDGSRVLFSHEDDKFIPFMTLMKLSESGGSPEERVEGAWEYDLDRQLIRAWEGVETFDLLDPLMTSYYTWSYPNATEVIVTDSYGEQTTYEYERDDSGKARVTNLTGPCPTCGMSPETGIQYDDPLNPLLPYRITDAEGNIAEYDYDNATGQMTSKVEPVGVPGIQQTTTWLWDTNYPAFPALIEQDSADSACPQMRQTTTIYNPANGNRTSRTISGCEEGAVFSNPTTYGYAGTTGGSPTSIDPFGYGTADVTSWTYDATRGDLFPLTRTNPLVGTTSYRYDAFNRRVATTDVNGVTTEIQYDDLDRVRFTIQRAGTIDVDFSLGDLPQAGDLTTENRYTFPLGDLEDVIYPRGNGMHYVYDHAGRMAEAHRFASFGAQPLERTRYTLDAFGQRTAEYLESWSGSWDTKKATEYTYANQCHLEKITHDPLEAVPAAITEFAYDCNGNLKKEWDTNHPSAGQTAVSTTEYTYDELDRKVEVKQPWDGDQNGIPEDFTETVYDYDKQNHLVAVVDAEGNRTEYTYSDRDLLTEEISLQGILGLEYSTTHSYNEHGELEETSDARSVTVTRVLDAADRLTETQYPDTNLNTTYYLRHGATRPVQPWETHRNHPSWRNGGAGLRPFWPPSPRRPPRLRIRREFQHHQDHLPRR